MTPPTQASAITLAEKPAGAGAAAPSGWLTTTPPWMLHAVRVESVSAAPVVMTVPLGETPAQGGTVAAGEDSGAQFEPFQSHHRHAGLRWWIAPPYHSSSPTPAV